VTPLASPAGQDRIAKAIAEVEALTSAELAVTVRALSGNYGRAHALCGFALVEAALIAVAVRPQLVARAWLLPVIGLAAFVLGALLGRAAPLRRLFTSTRRQRSNVLSAARSCFVELGVSRTSRRTGILIFASRLEREIAAVVDTAVPTKALGPVWTRAQDAMRVALERDDAEAFALAVGMLGPALADALPQGEQDQNELSDAPRV